MDQDDGVFTPDELALIERVKNSDLWRLIAAAMKAKREELFGLAPQTTADLHQRWGAMRELTTWLESGPTLVVYSRRLRLMENKDNG